MNLGQNTYVGLDTHRETINGTALDTNGNIICNCDFPNTKEALTEFMKGFYTWNTNIAIEACNFWRGPHKILKELGYKVKLANPIKCRQIARDKKTDKVDSKILADLIRINYLPEVYIPDEEILSLRDLTRNKISIMKMRVKIQVKIKSCLSRNGIAYPEKIWNLEGFRWLKKINDEEINGYLRIFEIVKKEENVLKRKIEKIVQNKEEMLLLKSIPGIGYFGAALIYAEIADINRFTSPKYLHAYSGTAPGIHQSGTKTHPSKRKEVNYWLKWIIGQCSGKVTLKKSKLQNYYFKIRKKKGWKAARKSVARKMLTIIWFVLREKIPYHES